MSECSLRRIVIGSYEQMVYGYSLPKCEAPARLRLTFNNHSCQGAVTAVAVARTWLAVASADETVRLFDLKKNVEFGELPLPDRVRIQCLVFLPDASCLYGGGSDGCVYAWARANRYNGKRMRNRRAERQGSLCPIDDLCLHPSGDLALSLSRTKRQLITWDIKQNKAVHTTPLATQPIALTMSPSGSKFSIAFPNTAAVYSLSDGKICFEFELPPPTDDRISCAFLCEDLLLLGTQNGILHRIPLGGSPSWSLQLGTSRLKCVEVTQNCRPFSTSSPDASTASTSNPRPINNNLETAEVEKGATTTTTSPSTSLVAVTAHSDGSIHVVDLQQFEEIASCNSGLRVTCLCLSEAKLKVEKKEELAESATLANNGLENGSKKKRKTKEMAVKKKKTKEMVVKKRRAGTIKEEAGGTVEKTKRKKRMRTS